MRSLAPSALTISLATALLFSCGGTQPIGAPQNSAQSAGRPGATGHYVYVTSGGTHDVYCEADVGGSTVGRGSPTLPATFEMKPRVARCAQSASA